MHGLLMRVCRSWVKIQCQDGRFCSVVQICTFRNNYTVFEETNCIATLTCRTNYPTKLQSLSEIYFLRFATSCLMLKSAQGGVVFTVKE